MNSIVTKKIITKDCEVNKSVLARLLDQAYMEVIPTPTILDRLVHIPRHCYVAITCSPVHGLEPTLKLVEELRGIAR